MTVQLNHTIVRVRDKAASTTFLTWILDVPAGPEAGPFLTVPLANGVTLDYLEVDPDDDVQPQHYAFLIDEDEFDAAFSRIRDSGLTYYADPFHRRPDAINHEFGGRGVYFEDPDGHNMELLTVPYDAAAAS